MGCDKACHSPEGRPFQGESEAINFGPVQGVLSVPNLTPDEETGLGSWSDGEIARAMVALRMFGPASLGEAITTPRDAPQPGTSEYGGYLVSIGDCRACHGEDLKGGPLPFAEPGDPQAADLPASGDLANWTEEEFFTAMRNGVRPDGRTINPEAMPWPTYGNMTDEDLKSIYSYLKSMPAESP